MSKKKLQGSLALLTVLLSTQGALCMTGGADKEGGEDAASTGSSSSAVSAPPALHPLAPAPHVEEVPRDDLQSALVQKGGGAVAGSLTSYARPGLFEGLGARGTLTSGGEGTSFEVSKAFQVGFKAAFPFASYHNDSFPGVTVLFALPVPGEENIKIALGYTVQSDQEQVSSKLKAIGFPYVVPRESKIILTPLNPDYKGMFKINLSGGTSNKSIALTRPTESGFLPEEDVIGAWSAFNAYSPGLTEQIKKYLIAVAKDYAQGIQDF